MHDYLARAERAGLKWPLPDECGEEQLNGALFDGEPVCSREPQLTQPDFALVHEQGQKSKHVTLQLLWEEYRAAHPKGYRYSRFCELYQRWRGTQDVVLRQQYKTGETARPYKPRDRAKVEKGVLVVGRWIVAALRNRRFFEIEELNQAIRELLVKLNDGPFRKREGSGASLFRAIDKPAPAPSPADRFDLSEWANAKVNIDYHVVFDASYYSVLYNLVHQVVEIRSMPTTVEIFHHGKRIASHLRSKGEAVTNAEHRPRNHREHLEWTPSRMMNWARTIGPHTA